MKTIEELLKNLSRPEVLEFGLVTNRLPSVNIGGKFEPVDDEAPTTERLMQMLVTMGGSRYLDALGDTPVQWTTRLDGVGVIAVAAIQRKDVVQARFTVAKRDAPGSMRSPSALPAPPPPAPAPPPPPPLKTTPPSSGRQPVAPRPVAPTQVSVAPPIPPPSSEEEWDQDDDEPTLQTVSKKAAAGERAVQERVHAERAARERVERARIERERAAQEAARAKMPPPIARRISTPTSVDAADVEITQPSGGSQPRVPTSTAKVSEAAARPSGPPGERRAEGTGGLDTFLAMAVAARASDLLLVAGRPALLRVASDLLPRTQPVPAEHIEKFTKDIVPARLRDAFERDGACDFAVEHPTHGRFRVHASRQRTGHKLTFRVVPREIPTISSLGLPEAILRGLRHTRGLFLVTGPAGQGKSATLAALLDHLNRETQRHIVTIEDPIEYIHVRKRALVSQREVGLHTRSTKARAVEAALREDADVIVVGDVDEVDVLRAVFVAVDTGRLVIATMNSPSAGSTIDQVIDRFPSSEQPCVRRSLSTSLKMITGQRLVPSSDRTRLHVAMELLPWSVILHGVIRDGRTHQIRALQDRGRSIGVLRLEDSLADLVRSEKVTLEAAKQIADLESSPDLSAPSVRNA
jgi:twitching motility protein PilT